MNYILVVGHTNGSVDYFGPFPSVKRAEKYAETIEGDRRWHIANLVSPFNVIKNIVYR